MLQSSGTSLFFVCCFGEMSWNQSQSGRMRRQLQASTSRQLTDQRLQDHQLGDGSHCRFWVASRIQKAHLKVRAIRRSPSSGASRTKKTDNGFHPPLGGSTWSTSKSTYPEFSRQFRITAGCLNLDVQVSTSHFSETDVVLARRLAHRAYLQLHILFSCLIVFRLSSKLLNASSFNHVISVVLLGSICSSCFFLGMLASHSKPSRAFFASSAGLEYSQPERLHEFDHCHTKITVCQRYANIRKRG